MSALKPSEQVRKKALATVYKLRSIGLLDLNSKQPADFYKKIGRIEKLIELAMLEILLDLDIDKRNRND